MYNDIELCNRYNNNIPLTALTQEGLIFLTDWQDIESLVEYFPFLPLYEITGILASVENGDYKEVYVTESSNPFANFAIYHPLDYYRIV